MGKFKANTYNVTNHFDFMFEFRELYENKDYVKNVWVGRIDGYDYICIDLGFAANNLKGIPDLKMRLKPGAFNTAKPLIANLWSNVKEKNIPPNNLVLQRIFSLLNGVQ